MRKQTESPIGEQPAEAGQATPRLVAYANPKIPHVAGVLETLARWANANGTPLSVGRDVAHYLGSDCESADSPIEIYDRATDIDLLRRAGRRALLICLGGDGTIIHGVRCFWPFEAAVAGVNLGSLSFNANVEPGQLTRVVTDWMNGQIRISPRMVVRVRLMRAGAVVTESVAVNDVVLSKHGDTRLIHLSLDQGGERVSAFSADGVIVATPTGSTAYNLSAGGPIVYPAMEALIVTAICPHTLAARPLILPPMPAVMMKFIPHRGRREATVCIDGQECWSIGPDDQVFIEQADKPLRLLLGPDAPYFPRLREKLYWSGELKSHDEDEGPS